jgi:DNA-binding transcriptional LysR family regulator
MEMHQVRYFLAVARELNFTRAAESCNVAQPSLTRAVKQLEEELGGELFRRERNLSHLTELGQRMLPMLQQCYDSALTAKSLAQSMKKGAIAPLPIAVSTTVSMMLFISFLTELVRVMPGLELRFHRGSNVEVAEFLKKGTAEVAIAGPLQSWERLDSWLLFSEPYCLAVGHKHWLASRTDTIAPKELLGEHLICRNNCDSLRQITEFLTANGGYPNLKHDIWTEQDLADFLTANLGVAIVPLSSVSTSSSKAVRLEGLDEMRGVYAYGVAGRQRSVAGNLFIKMLRAADWRPQEGTAPATPPDASAKRVA